MGELIRPENSNEQELILVLFLTERKPFLIKKRVFCVFIFRLQQE